jgi:hypothetical protein
MKNEPTITLVGGDLSTDAVITFPADANTRDNTWLTIDPNRGGPKYSLNVIRADEGIVLDLYLLDHEEEEPVASTYVFDAEASEILEFLEGDSE